MSNVIKILTDAMSAVATEAIEAAQQAETQQKRADEWYEYYQSKDAALEEAQKELDTVRQECNRHEDVANKLRIGHLKPGDRVTIGDLTLTIESIKEAWPGRKILYFEERITLSPYTEQQKGDTTQ